jgi:multidrug efflux pump subunit AcrA (membrane-fusion protein)
MRNHFPLQLIFADGSVYPEKGKFSFADRQVNPNTGTLQIVGLFSNANYMLRPGQYGRVRAQTQTMTNALLVPQRAVTELQGTYQVTVVDRDEHGASAIRHRRRADRPGLDH